MWKRRKSQTRTRALIPSVNERHENSSRGGTSGWHHEALYLKSHTTVPHGRLLMFLKTIILHTNDNVIYSP